jgi:hypothetical protein
VAVRPYSLEDTVAVDPSFFLADCFTFAFNLRMRRKGEPAQTDY